jgi:RHS repeat-associated protein
MLSDGERFIVWDADNKPTAITVSGVGVTQFGYSGDGARLWKVGPAGTVRYVGSVEDRVTEGVQVKHIMAAGLRIATRVVQGTHDEEVYYTHGDHLGSLNVLTRWGVESQRLTYLPFGETYTNTGTVNFIHHRYTGQEQDPETAPGSHPEAGLYHYGARYYNPELGRFLSPDPIVPEPGNPQALNRYSYVVNNPVLYTDPTGHVFGIFLGMLAGAAIGAAVSAVSGGKVWQGALIGAAIGGAAGAGYTAIGAGRGMSPIVSSASDSSSPIPTMGLTVNLLNQQTGPQLAFLDTPVDGVLLATDAVSAVAHWKAGSYGGLALDLGSGGSPGAYRVRARVALCR